MARLHRDVMRILITEIVSGDRAPGEKLPREVDLAEEFGVSRGVTRETIRALEERGLVTVKHGRGATVTDGTHWNVFDPDVLAVMLEGTGSREILAQYLECRRILEVEAAGIAAERARKHDVKRIGAALAQMEETARRPASQAAEERFHEADVAFHQALVAATHNRALAVLLERIHSALLLARFPLARPQHRLERALPEHRRILAAVEAGDPGEARAAMDDHLATIVGYLREGAPRRARRRAAA
jgi:DNA-binding FadR family transcriptional regulator